MLNQEHSDKGPAASDMTRFSHGYLIGQALGFFVVENGLLLFRRLLLPKHKNSSFLLRAVSPDGPRKNLLQA